MDKIIIKGLKIFGYHGVNDEEKEQGQNFVLDITLYKNLNNPCKTDNVDDTVSYSKVIKTVNRIFNKKKYDLIEKVAARVCEEIIKNYAIDTVNVVLKKPEAPMRADFEYVAVEITRSRGEEDE